MSIRLLPEEERKLGWRLNQITNPNTKYYNANFTNEIKRLRPDWFIKKADKNKKILLKMARSNKKRPHYKTKLGIAFVSYIYGKYCDKVFSDKIRKLRPDWFINTADENRKILLKMARSNKNRPRPRTKLASALTSYVYGEYPNKAFSDEIRKLRPDWFVRTKISDKHKKTLLKVARSNEKKPHYKTKLGKALSVYFFEKSEYFDKDFSYEIKKTRPDWFIKTADENKKTLLEMAKLNKNKPHPRTKLGNVLYNYTSEKHGSFDKSFSDKIKKMRPDWFIKTTERNKKILLEIAKSNKDRPHRKTKIGKALFDCAYEKGQSFDKVFSDEIKKMRPDWFVKTADINKKILLEMARSNKDRPHYKTKLGMVLSLYLFKKGSSFDKAFSDEIRKLRPDWFRKTLV